MKTLLQCIASLRFSLRAVSFALSLCALGASTVATAEIVTTFAGLGAGNSGDGGPAAIARLSQPTALVFDSAGNLYVSDSNNHRVRRIDTNGIITNFAGSSQGFGGDGGPAASASLSVPRGLAFDAAGNLYIADAGNQRIRKVDASGIITTVAGTGEVASGSNIGDGGPATAAKFFNPSAVAVDTAGLLYIVDQANGRIRRVAANGIISTFAGNGGTGFSGDGGAATSAQFNTMGHIAFNGSALYVADTGNGRIRRIQSGTVTTVAGGGATQGDGGPATSGALASPMAVTFDASGRVFVADRGSQLIRMFTVGGNINTSAGNGTSGFSGDNVTGIDAVLNNPSGIARGPDGYVYFSDTDNHRIRRLKMVPNPPVITGIDRTFSGLRVNFTPAAFGGYQGITSFTATCGDKSASSTGSGFLVGPLAAGTPYVCTVIATNMTGPSLVSAPSAPTQTLVPNVVTVTAPTSSIIGQSVTINAAVTGEDPIGGTVRFSYNATTIAGCEAVPLTVTSPTTGTASCTTNSMPVGGLSLFASFTGSNAGNPGGTGSQSHTVAPQQPQFITFSGVAGQLTNAGSVAVSATGGNSGLPVTFTTTTGNICVATGTNGAAIKLTGLAGTCTVRASQAGNVSYAAAANVDRSFTVAAATANAPLIATIAGGVAGAYVFDPDGGFGALTHLAAPVGVAVDSAGNVYVADSPAHRVRKVAPNGVVTTVAGNGVAGFGGDGGPAVNAQLNNPAYLALDSSGNVYIADLLNARVRKVAASTGIITTVAGSTEGFGGDGGPATSASLSNPYGLAIDGAGNLYIADQNNHRIRKVTPAGIISTYAGTGASGFAGDGGPATSAALSTPRGIGLDGAGNLYIAEVGGRRIRKVNTAGIISVIAGTGAPGLSGDGGPALAATLDTPFGLAVDSQGNVYFTEFQVGRVRKISPNGLIATVAGDGSFVTADGGDARATALRFPQTVAVDSARNLYIADQENRRVRKVTFTSPMVPAAPTITGATAGNGKITLAFAANYDGNASILDFTATCSHTSGNVSVTGALPPLALTGLINGNGYLCTVRARNAQGNSALSAAFGPVTPLADTAIALTGPATSTQGINATFTATVTGTALAGTVAFRDGGMVIAGCAVVPLAGNTASCTTNSLPAGPHALFAQYSGDAANAPSVSAQFDHTVSAPIAVRRNDVTGNGTSDVIWYHTGVFGLIGMNANGLALDPYYVIDVQSDANWKVAGIGDLNGDGRADVVWRNAATGAVYGLLMQGGTVLSAATIYTEPNLDWKIEQVADIDGDGKADLVWKNQATGDVYIMIMNGLAAAGGQIVYSEPNLDWKIVASGDMNGDGKADLLWRNVATGDVFAMLMDGFTVLSGGVIYTEPNLNWKIVGLADYNADGKSDVLWQNVATGDVFEMQMNGTAVSAGAVIYSEPSTSWRIVALGDYNGDGKADLLWQNLVSGHVYMMLMDGFTVLGAAFVYVEPDTQWQIVGP